MDDRWRILIRVRDLRARLALNEVAQQRRAQARAQATLDEVRRRQAGYEAQAREASAALAAPGHDGSDATFSAAQAQVLLSYATLARLKAQEAAAPIRRAQVQCQRAQEAADEARTRYRHETDRHAALYSQWRTRSQVARRRQLEREDEVLADELLGTRRSSGSTGTDERANDE